MDYMTNKALLIAVGIFVTLAITSGVLMVINNIQQIYGQVYETDTSITSQFGEFDKYDNTELSGIDLVNTYNKYKSNNLVNIYIGNNTAPLDKNIDDIDSHIKSRGYNYETIFKVTLEQKDGINNIRFIK